VEDGYKIEDIVNARGCLDVGLLYES